MPYKKLNADHVTNLHDNGTIRQACFKILRNFERYYTGGYVPADREEIVIETLANSGKVNYGRVKEIMAVFNANFEILFSGSLATLGTNPGSIANTIHNGSVVDFLWVTDSIFRGIGGLGPAPPPGGGTPPDTGLPPVVVPPSPYTDVRMIEAVTRNGLGIPSNTHLSITFDGDVSYIDPVIGLTFDNVTYSLIFDMRVGNTLSYSLAPGEVWLGTDFTHVNLSDLASNWYSVIDGKPLETHFIVVDNLYVIPKVIAAEVIGNSVFVTFNVKMIDKGNRGAIGDDFSNLIVGEQLIGSFSSVAGDEWQVLGSDIAHGGMVKRLGSGVTPGSSSPQELNYRFGACLDLKKADQDITILLSSDDTVFVQGNPTGIAFRVLVSSTSPNGYIFGYNQYANLWELKQISAKESILLQQYNAEGAFEYAPDGTELRVICVGLDIEMYVGGILIGTWVDGDPGSQDFSVHEWAGICGFSADGLPTIHYFNVEGREITYDGSAIVTIESNLMTILQVSIASEVLEYVIEEPIVKGAPMSWAGLIDISSVYTGAYVDQANLPFTVFNP